MLTHGDRTVEHAAEIVPELADTGLRYIGFKDVGADASPQRELTSLAHDAGFEVMLEVVSTSKEDELSSLHAASAAGVDWVLGGTHAQGCGHPAGRCATAPSRAGSSTIQVFCSARSTRSRPMPNGHGSRPRHGARPAGVSPSDRRSRRSDP
jgi:hypothetical protein